MLNDLAKAMKALDGKKCCFVCFLVCFALLLFCFCFSVLHCDSSMDCVSIQFSSLLYAHCRQD